MRAPAKILRHLLLAAGCLVIAGWQGLEHVRLRDSVHRGLLDRAHDISTTLGVVIRAQRRFGAVPRSRLEGALQELATTSELRSLTLVSPSGEVVAASGRGLDRGIVALAPGTVEWQAGTLTVAALVELGPDEHRPYRGPPVEAAAEKESTAVLWSPDAPEISSEQALADGTAATDAAPATRPAGTPALGGGAPRSPDDDTHGFSWRHTFWQTMRSRHPYWMSEVQFKELYEKQGLHKFLIVMSTQSADALIAHDLWLRAALTLIAFMAVGGIALAWHSIEQTSLLQVRLVQARAANTSLRELNTAAAGLAHETRNPLNIVRGLAQVIARDETTPAPVRAHADTIRNEVDRVTSRLGEFIDYSKPREPKLAPTRLSAVVRDVARALDSDREDKNLRFVLQGPELTVMADESLMRQAVFNLLLNAFQALPRGGTVTVTAGSHGGGEAFLEVRDNGPGIPPEARDQIFSPYFTLSGQGSGLGLAIVRQIVLAHHWDIAYAPADTGGAVFCITGLPLAKEGA